MVIVGSNLSAYLTENLALPHIKVHRCRAYSCALRRGPQSRVFGIQVHNPHLCFEEGFPASINGVNTSGAFDSHGHMNGKNALVGWMKTIVGVRVSDKGHNIMLLDSDSMFFSNPLQSFLPYADIISTNDCDDTYHPRHKRWASNLYTLEPLTSTIP